MASINGLGRLVAETPKLLDKGRKCLQDAFRYDEYSLNSVPYYHWEEIDAMRAATTMSLN